MTSTPKLRVVDRKCGLVEVWLGDGNIDSVAIESIYEVECIADATLLRRSQGADASGWVVASGSSNSDCIKGKRNAVDQLRMAVAEVLERRGLDIDLDSVRWPR